MVHCFLKFLCFNNLSFVLGLLLLQIVLLTSYNFLANAILIDNQFDEASDALFCTADHAPNACNLRSAWLLCQSEVAASASAPASVCRFDVKPTFNALFMDTISQTELMLTAGMQVEIYSSAVTIQPYVARSGRRFISSSGNEQKYTSLAIYNTNFSSFNNSALYLENTAYFLLRNVSFFTNGGTDGGAIKLVKSSGLIDGCKFSGNVATTLGGAMAMTNSKDISIVRSHFSDNVASNGGAISLHASLNISFESSTFEVNQAQTSGGSIFMYQDNAQITVKECYFYTSYAGFRGGAVYADKKNSFLRFSNTTFNQCSAYSGGAVAIPMGSVDIAITACNCVANVGTYNAGVLYLTNITRLLIESSNFSGGYSSNGGAVFIATSSLILIQKSYFVRNQAINYRGGSVLSLDSSHVLISDCAFATNYAKLSGGALMFDRSPVNIWATNITIQNSNFTKNSADNGGAINVLDFVDGFTIVRSHFVENTAVNTSGYGGAIYFNALNDTRNVFVEDCLFYYSVGYYGGAIFFGDVVDGLTIRRSSFVNNTAPARGYGGALYIRADTYIKGTLIEDCLFDLNVGDRGGAINLGSAVDSLTIRRSNFVSNTGRTNGGAIYCSARKYLKSTLIEDCLFDQNTASLNGGAMDIIYYIDGFSIKRSNFTNNTDTKRGTVGLAGNSYTLRNVSIESCIFRGNKGVGINLIFSGVNISITKSSFIENLSSGLVIGSGFKNVVLTDVNFEGNYGKYGSFSIGSNNIFISVQHTAFIRNHGASGVGIFMSANNSYITLDNVTFTENIASDKGGGLYVDQSNTNIDILGCIFDGNKGNFGGGLFIHRSNRYIAITATSFVNNKASISGGGIVFDESNMNILITDRETYSSAAVAESKHPYTYGFPLGYNGSFTVPEASSYWIVFDYKTNTWANDVVFIYDSPVSRKLFWKNSGSFNWPGVDSAVLQVDSPSIYIELRNVNQGIKPIVPAYGFKATIYPVFKTASRTPTRFENNYALTSDGGAVHVNYLQAYILMSQCIIRNNYAETKGGGLYFENTNSGTRLQRLSIQDNAVKGAGGALYFSTANYGVALQDTIFERNVAEDKNGGAIFLASGNGKGLYIVDNNVDIRNCTFTNNSAYSGGGVAVFYENNFTLSNCIFQSNYASQYGAGIYMDEANIASVNRVEFNGNKAFSGGGLYSALANTMVMTYVKFYSNEAFMFGGAIVSSNLSVLTVASVVLFNNKASVGGGIFLRGTYLWVLEASSRLEFVENRALLGSAFSIADLKSSPAVPNLKLHDILFANNTAIKGGTVFWIKKPGENNEPPGLNDTTLLWSGNYAAYGVKAATQCVFVDLPRTHNVTVYNTPIRPVISVALRDYYGQLIVSSNSTSLDTAIVDFQCFSFAAYTDGGTRTVSVMGHADFPLLQINCYPLGNVTMSFTAIIKEIALLGLFESDSYNPVSFSVLKYRNCIAGEYLVDRACVLCPTGTYLLAFRGNTVCTVCPNEAVMCFANQIFVRPGYWRRFPYSHALLECPGTGAGCIGGNLTGDGLCGVGYEGVLCAVCSSGYYKNSGTSLCIQCSGAIIFTPTFVVFLISLLCVLFLLSIAAYGQIKRHLSESPEISKNESEKAKLIKEKLSYWQERFTFLRDRFKILMSTFQIVCSIQASMQVKFPVSFANFLAIFKVFNFNFLDVMPLSCVYPSDYVTDLIIATTLPMAISMMIFIVFVIELVLYRYKYLVTEETDQSLFRRLKRRYFAMFLLLTYLTLPSTTTSIFRMFLCQDVDPYNEDKEDDLFLTSDYSLSCTTDRYKFGVIWAVIMIFVYPIGVISCYAVFLYKRRKEIINPDLIEDNEDRKAKVAMVEFLYRSYRPSCWYFELMETCRRLTLTSVLSTIAPGSSAQAVFAQLISLFFIKAYAVANPYQSREGAIIADIGQFQVFFTFTGALILNNDLLGKSWDDTVGAVLVMISLAVVFAIFYFEILAFQAKRLKRLEKLRLLSDEQQKEEDTDKKRNMAVGMSIEMVNIASSSNSSSTSCSNHAGRILDVLNQVNDEDKKEKDLRATRKAIVVLEVGGDRGDEDDRARDFDGGCSNIESSGSSCGGGGGGVDTCTASTTSITISPLHHTIAER